MEIPGQSIYKISKEKVAEIITKVGLTPEVHKKIKELSKFNDAVYETENNDFEERFGGISILSVDGRPVILAS